MPRGLACATDRTKLLVKSPWETALKSWFWTSPGPPVNHPGRPRGSQSGREKGRDEIQADAGSRLGTKKCFVLLCPIGEQFLLSSFREFVHEGYCFDHGLSGSCNKEMQAVRKLSVCYKIAIWFSQNTVCPKTKDGFPKIQAWAYNRYSRLHRSHLA